MIKKKLVVSSLANLFLLFLIISPMQAADVTLTIRNGYGLPGEIDRLVSVSLENLNDKVRAVQMDVCDADNYLACIGCTLSVRSESEGVQCSINELENGCCRGVIYDSLG